MYPRGRLCFHAKRRKLDTVTVSETQRLTTEMHNAIAALAAHLGHIEPGLTAAFDYRVDVHTVGGGMYPLIYRTD